MLELFMLYWIGSVLHAPTWYSVFWWIMVSVNVLKFCHSLYEKGQKSAEEKRK